jgi:predicted phosphodiesterase
MRIAVFSDVHGNLTAFRAVLEHINQQPSLNAIVFAGDLCLFGPRPQACIDLLKSQELRCIVGNTDEWIRQPPPVEDDMGDNLRQKRQQIREMSQWTEQQLTESSLEWLDALRQSFQLRFSPSSALKDDLLIVHANPVNLGQIIFPSIDRQRELYGRVRQDDDDLEDILRSVEAKVIAFGHLHIPNLRIWKDKLLANISSVSMPGDGDARAKYAIISWQPDIGWSVEYFKIPYPAEEEIKAFQEMKPPGWREKVNQLTANGYIAQKV